MPFDNNDNDYIDYNNDNNDNNDNNVIGRGDLDLLDCLLNTNEYKYKYKYIIQIYK